MKSLIAILYLTATTIYSQGQNVIDWDGQYKLQLSDFQSKATKIGEGNINSLYSSAKMDFSFQMSSYEFLFTKNFNSKVNNTFIRDASYIISPDEESAQQLLYFAQYEFDLTELYTRNFRKQLYEKKGMFSNASFFQPIYNDLQKEFADRCGLATTETDIGRNSAKLKEMHEQVLEEIQALSEFCKTCKPVRKK